MDFNKLKHGVHLYFVRHGESESNMKGLIGGGVHHDPDLTEKGREQARKAGEFLKSQGVNIDLVISSTLTRAFDTASIISSSIGYNKEIVRMPEIVEINTGIFTDHTYEEVQDKFPIEWAAFKERVWEGVPDSDSIKSIKERLARYFNFLFKECAGKTSILTVSHWGIMQWILKMINGSDHWKPVIQFRNCSISKLVAKSFEESFVNFDSERYGEMKLKLNGHAYIEWDYIGLVPYN